MKERINEIISFLEIANNIEATPYIKKDDIPILLKVLKDYLRYHYSHFHPNDEEKFKEIEKALGFDLFIWQKTFISMGVMRQTGETTARCLRDLVFRDSPIDYSNPPSSNIEKCERYSMIQIAEKLNNAGISTNPILRCKRDLEEYKRTHRNARKRTETHEIPPRFF